MQKNFWDITNKPQTKTKLKILEDYLSAWAKIFSKQAWCKQMFYIDCFAGRGKYHDDGQIDSVKGSPLRALDLACLVQEKTGKRMNCVFIEKDVRACRELEAFASVYRKRGIGVEMLQGDLNSLVDDVIKKINGPAFFFIDPAGINFKRETLEKLLSYKGIKEFLITYICKGVERCHAFGSKCDEDLPMGIKKRAVGNLRRVRDFFGEDWKKITYEERENLKVWLHPVISFNENALYKNRLSVQIIDILYNKNRNKYYLIFVSRNKSANKIIEDIFSKVKLDGTIWRSLPSSDQKKMFQGRFNI